MRNTNCTDNSIIIQELSKAAKTIDEIFTLQITRDNCGFERGITKEQIVRAAQKNNEIVSPFNVVKKRMGKIISVSYAKMYGKKLSSIARNMKKAADFCLDVQFSRFLVDRAKVLLKGGIPKSEKMWLQMNTQYPINFVVGPLLTYFDTLFGVKTFFSACLYIRDVKQERKIHILVKQSHTKLSRFMCANSISATLHSAKVEIGDVLAWGGEVKAVQAVAWSRPSGQPGCLHLAKQVGTKNLIFVNNLKQRIEDSSIHIFNHLFPTQLSSARLLEPTIRGIAIHEITHGFKVARADIRLRELFWRFEELKCDLAALMIATEQRDAHVVVPAIFVDLLAQHKLRQKVSARKQHGFSPLFIFSEMMNKKAITSHNHKLHLKMKKIHEVAEQNLLFIMHILQSGTHDEAQVLVDKIESQKGIINNLFTK